MVPAGSSRVHAFFARLFAGAVGRVVIAGICLAVVVGGLAFPPTRSWVLSAAGVGQGLKTDTGPVVKVGKGSPGRPKLLTKPADVRLKAPVGPKPGSGTVTPGAAFQAPAGLVVAVAAPAAAEPVLGPARQAAQAEAAITRAWTPPVASEAMRQASTSQREADAASPEAAWLAAAHAAVGAPTDRPAAAPADPEKGSYRVVPDASAKVAADPVAAAVAQAQTAPAAAPSVAGAAEAAVTVTTLDPAKVAGFGGQYVGFQVARADDGNAPVAVAIDYSGFAEAVGGDFGARLRLVSYPACVLSTPQDPACRTATEVVAVNDPTARKITAVVTPAGPGTPAATESPSPLPSATPTPSVSPSSSPSVSVTESTSPSPASDTSTSSTTSSSSSSSTSSSVSSSVADTSASSSATAVAGVDGAVDLSGRVRLAASGSAVFALAASASSSAGSYSATGLQASSQWSVGQQTGTFSYAVPLPFVPSPAGDEPELSLGYSSSAADGMTSTENPQGGESGVGWSMNTPFVERRYAPCANGSGNLCWSGDNATLNLDGQSGTLVYTGTSGDTKSWRMENDQGWKVEQVQPGNTENANGDANGEYWKITDTEGTKYYFGREKTSLGAGTNSTMTLPLYGQKSGDTCWPQANHMCRKAWRWNLAYIVDADGNVQRYTWEKDRLSYSISSGASSQQYDSVARLSKVEYGFTTATATTPAPARTTFSYKWRCTQSSSCQGPAVDSASWYPDVPFDLWCRDGASTCPNGPRTPVFFGFKKIDKVVSQYSTGTGYASVEQLDFDHAYPDPDGGPAVQVLDNVQRSGLARGTATQVDLPAVVFGYTFLDNRWQPPSGQSRNAKPRIGTIQNEFGGRTTVTYAQPDACDGQTLSGREDVQTSNCYPRRESDSSIGWYRKWLVTKVDNADAYGAPAETTSYVYDTPAIGGQGAGWHSDNDPLSPGSTQLWGDFRGYRKVYVLHGTGANQTTDEYRYFRGLHGDHLKSGTRSVTLYTASSTDAATSRRGFVDESWLNGMVFEHRVLRNDNTDVSERSELSSEQTTYDSFIVANGIPGPYNIYHHKIVQVDVATEMSMLEAGGADRARKHTTRHAYDHIWGREIWSQDDGDPTTGIGPSCDYTVFGGWNGTEWVPDMTTWIIDAPRQELSTSTACPTTITQVPTSNLISRTDHYYGTNWADLTTAPSTGSVTKTVEWSDASTPFSTSATKYDARGRVVAEIDPDNYVTGATSFDTAGKAETTAYTETNGVVTSKVETDEADRTTTTVLDPGRQQPASITDLNGRTTTMAYDTLGRLLTVRLPGDDFDVKTFTYTVSNTAPSVVRTEEYPAKDAAPIRSWSFLDSQGRIYQTQKATATGGQMVAGTRFDAKGDEQVEVKAFATNASAPGSVVPNWYAAEFTATIPSQTLVTTDDVDREVKEETLGAGNQVVTTETTAYDGYATTTTPPSNGGASMVDIAPITITDDAYERQVTRTQNGLTAKSTYDIAGNLIGITSPTGKTIANGYDWLGNQTTTTDPDAGTSTTDYYPSGAVKHSKDAKGQELFTAVDVLGREVATYQGASLSGEKLSETVYDGVPLDASEPLLGAVTSQTSWDDGHAYTQKFGYDQRYRTTRNDQIIPAVAGTGLGLLAGTYTTTRSYDALDRETSVTHPAVGGLDAETVTTGWAGEYATTLTSPLASYVAETTYTNTGQLAGRILGTAGATGSVKRTYGWEPATGRLTNQAAATPSTHGVANAQNDTYTYSPTGDITKITDGVAGQQQCFTYDALDRLTAALTSTSSGDAGGKTGSACAADATGPDPYQQAYGYDNDGNLTSLTTAGVVSTYGYGTNAAAGVTGGPHAPTTVTKNGATTSYSYDPNGNLIKRVDGQVTTTYAWDLDGKLAGMTIGSGATAETARFVEGPDDTRWVRITKTETVAYLDGQEIHLPAGSTSTSQATGVRYYDLDDHTVATRTTTDGAAAANGVLSWILADRQDSATVAVNATTGAATRDRYLPYGGNRNGSGKWTMPTDRGWQGQVQDDDTGLDYLNARYYDPVLAHFISVDEMTDNDQTAAANPYGYAAANPILFNDPTGLWPGWVKKAANFVSEHRDTIVDIAVGAAVGAAVAAGCAATAGIGCAIAAGAIAGAAGSSAGYGVRVATGKESFSAKNLAKSALGGAAGGVVGGRVGGKAAAAVAKRVIKPVAKAATKAGGKVAAGGARAVKTVATKAKTAGKASVAKGKTKAPTRKAASCPVRGGAHSFAPTTPVLMADGTAKPIADIQVGDEVISEDPDSGVIGTDAVIDLHRNHDLDLVDLHVKTESGATTLHTTAGHPFYDATASAWVAAVDLTPGHELHTLTGESANVLAVEVKPGAADMYNLSIESLHTYYVVLGGVPVLVHNAGPKRKPAAKPKPAVKKKPAARSAVLPTRLPGRNRPLTPAQEADLAKYLGFKRTKDKSHGKTIYTNGKRFISQDIGDGNGSHNGGTWKIADSASNLRSKQLRSATTDALLNPIGC